MRIFEVRGAWAARQWRWLIGGIVLPGLLVAGWAWAAWPDSRYDLALARWRAQHVTAYEITTDRIGLADSLLGSKVTLRVSNGGQTIEILGPKGVTTPTPGDLAYYQGRTVEGIFTETKHLLDSSQGNAISDLAQTLFSVLSRAVGGSYRWEHMEYNAQYDPVLGYVTHLQGQLAHDPGVAVFDADWELVVKDFKILQRSP